jgi:alkaline phosphatase
MGERQNVFMERAKQGGVTQWSRRDVLGWGLGGAAWMATAPALMSCRGTASAPRNIIFLVSDGMSQGVPTLAETFAREVRGRGTHLHALLTGGEAAVGYFDTASEVSLVTDSAAAASAWGSGRRVPNGLINQYYQGTPLTPLIPLVHERGKAAGLVTTARLTHATPAGFVAQVPHRDYEDAIAAQYFDQAPEVLLGGGSFHFSAETREDGRDLLAEFSARAHAVALDRGALLKTGGLDRIFGAFTIDHLPYTLDQSQDPALIASVPTLEEMTRAALGALARRREGFFLMVEGARIDHAAHANDAAGILWEQLAFDDAVGAALAFQKANPDTLVIVSSDHGNANPGLNGMGPGYKESTGCFQRVARARATAATIRHRLAEKLRRDPKTSRATVRTLVQEGTGFTLSDGECGALLDVMQDRPVAEVFGQHANFFGQLGQILGNWNGIGWTGVTHTADWTLLTAQGPGQDAFQGLLKNTDFFDRVTSLWGIRHRNPANPTPPEPSEPAERALADPSG